METTASLETSRVVRTSALACVLLAVLSPLVGLAVGHAVAAGLFGLGLLLGASNGYLTQRLVRTGLPIAATSLFRIMVLTAVALLVGLPLGLGRVFLVVAGVAAAQLVLAGSALAEMTRR